MLRETLINILKRAVFSQNYAAYTGFAYRMSSEVQLFPAAWILPMQLVKVEGREEGELIYHVTIHLMKLNKKKTEEAKEHLWAELEEDALRLVEQIRTEERILYVEHLAAYPAEFSLTKHGELSLKVEFDVQMHFSRPRVH